MKHLSSPRCAVPGLAGRRRAGLRLCLCLCSCLGAGLLGERARAEEPPAAPTPSSEGAAQSAGQQGDRSAAGDAALRPPERAGGEAPAPAPAAVTTLTPAAQPAAAESDRGAPLAGYTEGGFFLRSSGNNFVLFPNGRLNVDGFFFPSRGEALVGPPPGGPPPAGITPDSPLDQRPRNTIFIRRARAELAGTLLKHFDWYISGEFATDPNQIFFQSAAVSDVWVNVNYTPWINVMAGQYDAPFSLEGRTADKFIDFMERSLAVRGIGAPTNKELGVMAWGLSPNKFLHYTLGVFNGDGPNARNVDSRFDIIGRATLSPLAFLPAARETRWLQEIWVGGSVWWGQRAEAPYPMQPLSTQGGVTLMPPLFALGGTSFNLGNDGDLLKWGVELNAPVGPFGLRFELVRLEREGLGLYDKAPTVYDRKPLGHVSRSATAFYVQAWYWILGDYRILPTAGQQVPRRWTGYKPDSGPWKLGLFVTAKYERLVLSVSDLDDGKVPLPAKDQVLGGMTVDTGELGLNLWLTRHLRFSANYIVNWVDGDMKLIQGGTRFPPNGPLIQPTYTPYQSADHELLFRAAVGL